MSRRNPKPNRKVDKFLKAAPRTQGGAVLPHTAKVGFTGTRRSYVFIGCYRMNGRQIGYENMGSDGEGRDPREPRLGRASTGAPPVSAAPQLEKGMAPSPEMPPPAPPCVLFVAASPRCRRHVRFCVFPTGGAVLLVNRLASLGFLWSRLTFAAINTKGLQGCHLPSAFSASGCRFPLSCPSW